MYDMQKNQDPLKMLPLYDIPIIQPQMTHHKQHPHKKTKRNRNPLMRFIKRIVYYKPTTFIGTNLMVAFLTLLVQNTLSKPEATHHYPPPQRAERKVEKKPKNIFNENTLFTVNDVNGLLNPLIQALSQTAQNNTVNVCEGCGDVVQFKTNSGNEVEVTCLTCQKPFQKLPVIKIENTRE